MNIDTDRIIQHVAKAERKHPHFANSVISEETRGYATEMLADARKMIATDAELNQTCAEGLLICEIAEIFDAYVNGRRADAVDECFDAIAVLLRMAEMIEKEGDANAHNR